MPLGPRNLIPTSLSCTRTASLLCTAIGPLCTLIHALHTANPHHARRSTSTSKLSRVLSHTSNSTFIKSIMGMGMGMDRGMVMRMGMRMVSTNTKKTANKTTAAQVDADHVVAVTFPDGQTSKFHSIWLRDHCRCPKCFHPVTKQRLVPTHAIPPNIQPSSVECTDESIQIVWQDGHISSWNLEWLRRWSYWPRIWDQKNTLPKQLWGSELIHRLPTVHYDHVMSSNEGLLHFLHQIYVHGLVFISNTPPTTTATEQLARRIAPIRQTHYGGFWDFTSDMAHGDLAYSNYFIGLHHDTTYFNDVVGLQLFHLLMHDGVGGESMYADGFKVAKQMKHERPDLFEVLCRVGVSAHSAGDEGVVVSPTPTYRPVIGLDEHGEVYQVRFNNDDRSPLLPYTFTGPNLGTPATLNATSVPLFYEALQHFHSLLTHPSNQLQLLNRPGTAVIVDNWRVLHARQAFTGKRRLCGAYLSQDEWMSKYRVLMGQEGRDGVY